MMTDDDDADDADDDDGYLPRPVLTREESLMTTHFDFVLKLHNSERTFRFNFVSSVALWLCKVACCGVDDGDDDDNDINGNNCDNTLRARVCVYICIWIAGTLPVRGNVYCNGHLLCPTCLAFLSCHVPLSVVPSRYGALVWALSSPH